MMRESKTKTRRWFSVRISGMLSLLLQAVFLQAGWILDSGMAENFAIFITFTALGGVALLAGIIFFFLYHTGWLLAMIVQSLALIVALILHFQDKAPFVELMMLYCILMVLFLNSVLVRTAFHAGPSEVDSGEIQ